jgi:hypothetical protein
MSTNRECPGCVICYNDYGKKSPEGVTEMAVRLPKCRHVFGEMCLKKWLTESALCPYCRDELPAEARREGVAGSTFMSMIRARTSQSPEMSPEELFEELLAAEGQSPPGETTGHTRGQHRRRAAAALSRLRRTPNSTAQSTASDPASATAAPEQVLSADELTPLQWPDLQTMRGMYSLMAAHGAPLQANPLQYDGSRHYVTSNESESAGGDGPPRG